MKRIVMTCAAAALMLLSTGASAANWSWDVSSGLYGADVYRGAKRDSTSLLTEGTVTWQATPRWSLNARVANTLALTTTVGAKGLTEDRYDVYTRYKALKSVNLVAGWLYYDHNKTHALGFGGLDTQEAYAGIETKWFGLNPSVYLFYDYNNNVGLYGVGTVSKSWTLGKSGWTLDTLGAVGFDSGRFVNGFQNGLVSFDLNYPLAAGLEFGPRLDLHFPAKRTDATAADSFRPVFGLGFNYSGKF